MANTKTAMDTLVDTFNTHIDAGSYSSAKATLIKISVHLATLPSTAQLQWGRTIETCRAMLQELIEESSTKRPHTVLLRRDMSGT